MTDDARTVTYYHQVDDPYSHLVAQVLPALTEAYDIDLQLRLAPPPADEMAPDRGRLEAYARRDAAELARYYPVDFPARPAAPEPGAIARGQAVLAAAMDAGRFVEAAPEVGDALWRGEDAALDRAAQRFGETDAETARARVAEGGREREQRGHYLGAMLYHDGVWHWGLDRLGYLEHGLRRHGLGRGSDPALSLRPSGERPVLDAEPPVTLDFYFSFRSPYSYLAVRRMPELLADHPVRLDIKPVLPMIMRGMPVPEAKRNYIMMDTLREAQRHEIPFGHFADPAGAGVERAMAIFDYAREQDRALAYLQSVATGIFAEAVDTATDDGLSALVERAGLDWSEARRYLGGDDWRDWAERNQQDLFDLDLWGVPSFHVGGYAAWGQDRLWMIADKLASLTP